MPKAIVKPESESISKNTTKREDYIAGNLFSVGDVIVSRKGGIYEVFELGTNYLTVCNFYGDISKLWIEEAILANHLRTDLEEARPKCDNNQFAYHGHVTHNFTEDISLEFDLMTLQEHDRIAMTKLVREMDKLLGAINNTDNDKTINELKNNTLKYLRKSKLSLA